MRGGRTALLGAALVACILAGSTGLLAQERSSQRAKVTIGYSRLRISLPIFVAAQKGYFSRQSLDIDLQPFDTAVPLMDALVAGHIQVGGFTAFPITFNAMLRSRTTLLFVGLLVEDQAHPISVLLRRKDAAIGTVADLKGKRIGILPTIAYRAWLEEILRRNGIDARDVTIIPVQPLMTSSALASGQIDAAFTNDPASTTALQTGVAELVTPDALVPKHLWSPFPFGAFNVRKDFADANPGLVRRIVDALNDGIADINTNPAAAKEHMKEYLPTEQRQFVKFYPSSLYVPSHQVDEQALHKVARSYLEMRIIEKPLLLDGLVYR
ncbi:MAG TPA: ABC transporter substrate-binding protein [Candidatus Acidoferrum sp.]|nr:ABC transporter substrate-binding protein [Candidatus Acidoferrum sp.]